jgi:hypothetical protein
MKATSIKTNSKVLVDREILLWGRFTTIGKEPLVKIPILKYKLNPRN